MPLHPSDAPHLSRDVLSTGGGSQVLYLHCRWLPASHVLASKRSGRRGPDVAAKEMRGPKMPDEASPDPTVHRRRLRSELRKAREAAGMTQRDVAAAMDWSQSKLIRIETGAVSISTNDLRALLRHYGLEHARIENLVEVARASRDQPRWSVYKDVAEPEYIAFLGYESSASIIRNFEPLLIPGGLFISRKEE